MDLKNFFDNINAFMLKLFNTLTRKKQIFKPLKDSKGKPSASYGAGKKVGLYTCGPTVYDYAHLGNLRTYIFEDVLRRTLKYNGYKVKQAMNITDVEDKIIKKMRQENKSLAKITEPYTKIFFEDLKKLNIEKAEVYPKATEHIKEMIALIKKLMAKKIAYQGEDGSIYFNIAKFKNYGKLSDLKKRKIKIRARISSDEYNKEQAQDFVLWKTAKPNEPSWPSPFGQGRPGWHIECSAMSAKYLGQPFDIHAGAVDLIFPHHENEIAQSEAAIGKKFANFWIHGEHLLVNGQKMAKSLNNFYTLKDLESAGWRKKFNPLAFRYLALTTHYRSKLNFTWESLEAAANALDNLKCALSQNEYSLATAHSPSELVRWRFGLALPPSAGTMPARPQSRAVRTFILALINKYEKKFLSAINDDLNMPKAIAIMWQIIKDNQLSDPAKKKLILKFDEVFGLGLAQIKPVKIPQKIKGLAAEREKFRINKQFIQADGLRKKIEELGYKIEDTNYGPKITAARH